jgi:hypothetical protein
MPGKIHRYLADDHERLDALLERAMVDPDNVDMSAYGQFRSGLLNAHRHGGKDSAAGGATNSRRRAASACDPTAPRSRRIDGSARAVAHRRDRRGATGDSQG